MIIYVYQDEINEMYDGIESVFDDVGDEELAQVDMDVAIMKGDNEGVSVFHFSTLSALLNICFLNFQDKDLCQVDIETVKELWNMDKDKEGVSCLKDCFYFIFF